MTNETNPIEGITLKELAPYLPYGLKGDLVNLDYFDSQINCELYRIETGKTKENSKYEVIVIVGDCESDIKDFTPYLRPLSDLTKDIEVNGKRFVPIECFENMYYTLDYRNQCIELMKDPRWLNQCDYMLVQHLIEWHFDVFGLIDQGLAVNINDIHK